MFNSFRSDEAVLSGCPFSKIGQLEHKVDRYAKNMMLRK